MMLRTVAALGALVGLAVPIGGLVLPASPAWAQYAPPYGDAPPAYRGNPGPVYRGTLPPADDDDEDDAPMPPPGYRGPPPPGPYAPGPNASQDPYGRGQPPADPRYGYGAPPPNGGPYAQPPMGGPYSPPPPQYGARPDDQNGPTGTLGMRPPMGIGPDQEANAPDQGMRPGPGQQPRQISPDQLSSLPPEDRPETDGTRELPAQFRRQLVTYPTREPAGTIIIDTPNTYLYLILGNGQAMRYGIGVGREGFTWSGTERISRMAEWPDWHPPKEMIERQPYLPRMMAGGEGNPLGARALYLGKTLYRIHGTNQPSTIGSFVSSGCVRLVNADIEDLFQRVSVGTRVVVLPGGAPPPTAQNTK
jgi:lipoprotein-anchoring transpeptidase ErfK/SrfK